MRHAYNLADTLGRSDVATHHQRGPGILTKLSVIDNTGPGQVVLSMLWPEAMAYAVVIFGTTLGFGNKPKTSSAS